MKRKHKVLSWWATLLLVLLAFVAVAGITALVLYLLGELNPKVVMPESMAFSQELGENDKGYFVDESNLRIASDVSLTLTTPTEGVTEDEVTLFLDGVKGKLSNGVIKVPEKVKLNKPFKVELETTENFANGGTAVITAVSQDVTLQRKTLNVFVDKPVQSFEVEIPQAEQNQIIAGSAFNILTTFSPSESKWAFSSKNGEEKRVFFAGSSEVITYDWDQQKFKTKSQIDEGYDDITIYVFANAYFQKQVLEDHQFDSVRDNPAEFSSRVTDYLKKIQPSENTYLKKDIRVYVRFATITYVEINPVDINGEQSTPFELTGIRNQPYTLTTRSNNQDGSLNAYVRENESSSNQDGLLGNFGIKISRGDSNLKIDNSMEKNPGYVGEVMKVVAKSTEDGQQTYEISREQFDKAKYDEYLNPEENVTYYILPFTATTLPTDFGWNLVASDTEVHTLSINYFTETREGGIKAFFDFEAGNPKSEKTFTFQARDRVESPATWKDNNAINMEIYFDDETGEPVDAQQDLSLLFGDIPETNVYTRTKYFLYVDGDYDVEKAFNVKAGKTFDVDYLGNPLTVLDSSAAGESGLKLYELEDDSLLIAKQKVPENVRVFVVIAIIKENEEDRANYQIVNLSELKSVYVDSTLAFRKMSPKFQFTPASNVVADPSDGVYYVSSINLNDEGNRQNVINFVFEYECAEDDPESWANDAGKILFAFEHEDLRVVCTDISQVEDNPAYCSLAGNLVEMTSAGTVLTSEEERTKTLYFTCEIEIDSNLFGATANASQNIVTSRDIYLWLEYNDGHNLQKQQVCGNADGENDDHFVVYFPVPKGVESLTAPYQTDPQIQGGKDIQVDINGDGEVKMVWNGLQHPQEGEDFSITQIFSIINSNLTFTLKDQHDRTINTNYDYGIYKIVFVEEGPNQVLVFNSHQNALTNFHTTSGETTTTMAVKVYRDGEVVLDDLRFNFTIKSLGVSKIEKEDDGAVYKPGEDRKYVSNDDTVDVEISKFMMPKDDEIDLKKLIKVYLGQDEKEYTGEQKVYLNETFVRGLSKEKSTDLARLLVFENINYDVNTSMEDFLRNENGLIDLTKMSIRAPFNEDVTLELIISDADGTRFQIPVYFTILKQVSIGNGFKSYNDTNGYSDYLVNYENAATLFAGNSYQLNSLFPLMNNEGFNSAENKFTWENAYDVNNGMLVVDGSQQNQSLLSIEKVGEKAYLKIADVFSFTTVRFVIYYGSNSYYALNTGTITLYLNPNVAIVEKTQSGNFGEQFLNIQNLSEKSVSNFFGFYRATSYINKVAKKKNASLEVLTGTDVFDISNMLFSNITNGEVERFIKISKLENGETKCLFEESAKLALELGQVVLQTFNIQMTNQSNKAPINAVKIKLLENGEREIIKCADETGRPVEAQISFGLGFGEDEFATVQNILTAKDGGSVQVVNYFVQDGERTLKAFLLLEANTSYNFSQGFSFGSKNGDLSSVNGGIMTRDVSGYFSDANTLTVKSDAKDALQKSLQELKITLNIIVTRIGDKFVYYSPKGEYEEVPPEEALRKYNSFEGKDFWTLIQNPASVNAYQKLLAGKKYKLVHELDGEDDQGVYGFYYNKLGTGKMEFTYRAYRLVNGVQEELASDVNLISRDGESLTIQHLSSKHDNIFVECTLSFSLSSNSFSYKYLIKIIPDCDETEVHYPYAEDAEYLDEIADAYVGEGEFESGEYVIHLDEIFGETNSNNKNPGAKRFEEPKLEDSDGVGGEYALVSAKRISDTGNESAIENFEDNEWFEYAFEDDGGEKVLRIVMKQDVKLTVIVQKTFTIGGMNVFGGELNYEIRIGQGTKYSYELQHRLNIESAQNSPVAEHNGAKYFKTLKAGEEESVFTVKLSVTEGAQSSPVKDFWAHTKVLTADAQISDALQDLGDGKGWIWLEDDGTNSKQLHLKPRENVSKDITLEISIYTNERVALKLQITVESFYVITRNTDFTGGNEYAFVGEKGIFKNIVDTIEAAESPAQDFSTNHSVKIALLSESPVKIDGKDVDKSKLIQIKEAAIEFAHLPEPVTFKFEATITKTSMGNATYSFNFEITVKESISIDTTKFDYVADIGNVYGGLTYDLYLEEKSEGVDEFRTKDNLKRFLPELPSLVGQYAFSMDFGDTNPVLGTGADGHLTFTPNSVSTTQGDGFIALGVTYTFDSEYSLQLTLRVNYAVLPSVETKLYTPSPNGTDLTNVEYLDVENFGTETLPRWQTKNFEDFFKSPADFAQNNGEEKRKRVEVTAVDAIKQYESELSKIWTISVSKIENVSLTVTGQINSTITGVSTLISKSPLDALNLQFELLDGVTEGVVEFSISVNAVEAELKDKESTYKVQIMRAGTSAVTVSTDNAPNYDNNRETVYAEDLAQYGSPKLFEKDRILQFNAKIAGTYYLELDKKTETGNQKKYKSFTATSTNTLTNVDLGESLKDYEISKIYTNHSDESGYSGELTLSERSTYFNVMPYLTSRLVAYYARGTADEQMVMLGETRDFVLIPVEEDQKEDQEEDDDAPEEEVDTTISTAKRYDEVVLQGADLDNVVKYSVALSEKFNEEDWNEKENLTYTNRQYNLMLAVDFEVKNNSDTSLSAIDLIAGETATLLGEDATKSLNNQIHIKSKRTGKDYTASMMKERVGIFKLDLYGFADTPILFKDKVDNEDKIWTRLDELPNPYTANSKEEELALSAGEIHDRLQKEEVKVGESVIKYHTGLSPRASQTTDAGTSINSGTEGQANTLNYLVLQGQIPEKESKENDYKLIAQGCNNDGNHVMVKISYKVKIGETDYAVAFANVLFRIIPNTMKDGVQANSDNSSITFRRELSNNDTQAPPTNYTRTFGGFQTVANNYDNMFEISENNVTMSNTSLFFVNVNAEGADLTTDKLQRSAINAQLYGNSTKNAASSFTFTYKSNLAANIEQIDDDNLVFNDFTSTPESDKGIKLDAATVWKKEFVEKTQDEEVQDYVYTGKANGNNGKKIWITLTSADLALGEKLFYVDFQNDFGYRGRFFFKIVSSSNPIINNMSTTTLEEGKPISIGTEFQTVDLTQDADGFIRYENFTYSKSSAGEGLPEQYNNTIGVANNDGPTFTVESAKLDVQLKNPIEIDSEQVSNFSRIVKLTDFTPSSNNLLTKTFKIVDGKGDSAAKWTYSGGEHAFDEEKDLETFLDATVSLSLKFSKLDSYAKVRVSYGYVKDNDSQSMLGDGFKRLACVPAPSISYKQPTFARLPENNDKKVNITLSNIGAFAFKKGSPIIYDNATEKYFADTKINKIKVTDVAFYYNEQRIDKNSDLGYALGKTIVTSEEYCFFDGTAVVNGAKDDQNGQFTVPTITGKAFGTNDTLNNVTMRITLTDNAENKAVLSKLVTIKRDAIYLFNKDGKTQPIEDGTSPQPTENLDVTIINDTLEVVLDKDESTSFILLDHALDPEKDKIIMENGLVSIETTKTAEDGTQTKSTTTPTKPISFKNVGDYTYTEYLSVTNNLIDGDKREENFKVDKDNTDNSGKFFIYQIVDESEATTTNQDNPTLEMFKYNGKTDIGTSENKINVNKITIQKADGKETYTIAGQGDTPIETYPPENDALRLYIPSVKALGGEKSLKKTLYFLYAKAGEDTTYQFTQEFEIKPIYSTANTSSSGQIEVDTYYEVRNDSTDEKFYYIPLSAWAEDINLVPSVGSTEGALTINSHEFTFRISSDTPSGSAFIDETGMITTSKGFNIDSHIITVEVFMKVSGADGCFEEDNTQLSLGKFTLGLKKKQISSPTETDNRVKDENGAILVVPNNFTLYGKNWSEDNIGEIRDEVGSFACKTNTTINFHELLDKNSKIAELNLTNKKYHIICDDETAYTLKQNYIYCADNIDRWTFTTPGTKKCIIILTGREGGDTVAYELHVAMTVYENNANQNNIYAIEARDGSAQFDLSQIKIENAGTDEEISWFEHDTKTNVLSSVNKSLTLNSSDGLVQQKTLIATTENAQQVFNMTFFLYSTSENQVVVSITPNSTYDLKSCFEDAAEIREFNANNNVVSEPIVSHKASGGVGENEAATYVVVKKDSRGQVVDVTKQEIRFKVMNTSVDETCGTFAAKKKDEQEYYIDRTVIETKIKEIFKLQCNFVENELDTSSGSGFMIQTRAKNGVLTNVGERFKVSATATRVSQEFLVTYRNEAAGNIQIKRVFIYFYLHENEEEISIAPENLQESSPFYLSKVAGDVIKAINENLSEQDKLSEKNAVNFYTVNQNTGTLQSETSIRELNAGEPIEKTYFVEIGGRGFLIKLRLEVPQS